MKPLFVALDLEFNQPSQRIIQLGAAVADSRTGAVLSRFSVYVNPQEALAPEISTLCGITPAALDLAGTLDHAHAQLRNWLAPFSDQRQLNPLTWGGGDSASLRSQLGLEDQRWLFGRRWIDVKTAYTAWCHAQGREATGGLSSSMKRVALQFQGRPHDAADDSVNTARMYFRLLELMRSSLPADTGPPF